MEVDNSKNVGGQDIKLKRVIGLFDACLIIVGMIIGSGIFITPAGILGKVTSVSASLMVWVISGFVSLLGAFCFAELAYLVPLNGGGYAYLQATFGHYKYGRIPGFLNSWLNTLINTPGTVAVMSLTSSEYFCKVIFGDCGVSRNFEVLLATILLISNGIMNCVSVKWCSRLNSVLSMGKIGALALITLFGIYFLINGKTENLKPDFTYASLSPTAWVTAIMYGLYSFDGWANINAIVEELKNPKRNLPLAIVISMSLCIGLYLMANISYLTQLSAEEMIASPAVALSWADKSIGRAFSILVILSVAIANYGAGLSFVLCTSRIGFAAARDGNLPKLFGMLNVNYLTPIPVIVLQVVEKELRISNNYDHCGNILKLVELLSFSAWIFYGLNLLCLIILKRKKRKELASRKIQLEKESNSLDFPYAFPVIMIIFSILLVFISLSSPNIGHLLAILLILSGLIYYIPFSHFKKSFAITDKLSLSLQILFNVVPEDLKET